MWANSYKCCRDGPALNTFFRKCSGCMDCRLTRACEIATRCVHESYQHKNNCFLTLTYNDENLPDDLSLSTDTMQKFWKKLRRRIGSEIKYYAAGEYGEGKGERPINPHYHACVFNYDPPDKKFWKKSPAGDNLYKSKFLDAVWGLGNVITGDLTFESAAYVARYTCKKIYGDAAPAHYGNRLPEQSWSSNGIAKQFALDHIDQIYAYDEVIMRGRPLKPPPYYDKLLLAHDPFLYDEIVFHRQQNINNSKNNVDLARFYDNTGKPITRSVSEVVKLAQLKTGQLDKER